jgi:hypothetical protein
MQYKTLTLQLIRAYPEIHNQLKRERAMLPTVDRLAWELKTRHEALKTLLAQTRPGSDLQISSEALEIALRELEERLSLASMTEDSEPLSLDAAMAYLSPTATE